MFKKAAIVFIWSTFSIIILTVSSYSLLSMNSPKKTDTGNSVPVYNRQSLNNYSLLYSSLPQSAGIMSQTISSADARSEILFQYLKKRNSPLAPYSELIVSESDKNDIDFRLPVAIAECESNLCEENKFPENSYNCWGYGIHSQGTLKFTSFDIGIQTVIKGLKKFKDRGYMTSIEKLMELYTPPSIPLGGPWAKCVTHFMDILK